MMLLPLMFLIGVHDWVPARWGSGDPKTLDLLRGGAINCLLLEAENWNGEFIESAAARHVAVLGGIRPGDAVPDLAGGITPRTATCLATADSMNSPFQFSASNR